MSSTPMPRARKGRTCQRAASVSGGDTAAAWEGTRPPCSPQGPTSPTVPSSSPSTYLGGGCIEGDAQQRAKPQARGHGESHEQDSGQAHGPLGLGAVPPQHGDAGVGQLEEHSGLAGSGAVTEGRRGTQRGGTPTMRR